MWRLVAAITPKHTIKAMSCNYMFAFRHYTALSYVECVQIAVTQFYFLAAYEVAYIII